MVTGLVRNLIAGLKLVSLAPVHRDAFVLQTDQLIALLLIAIALQVGGAAIPYWPVAGIWAYGLGLILLRYTIMLAVLQVLAGALGDWRQAGPMQVMVLAGAIWAQTLWLIVANTIDWAALPVYSGFVISNAFLGLSGIVAVRALRLCLSTSLAVSVAGGALLVVLIGASGMLLDGAPLFRRD